MENLQTLTLHAALKSMRDQGNVPLGIVSYNMSEDQLDLSLFLDVSTEEAKAILAKFDMKFVLKT